MIRGIYRLILILLLGFSSESYGELAPVLILYPQVDEPLHSLYTRTIQGIETQVGSVNTLAIPEEVTNLQSELDRLKPNQVIALGKRAIDNIQTTTYRKQTLFGWAHLKALNLPGVDLALAGHTLTQQLAQIAPFIRKVYIVQETAHPAIANDSVTPANSSQLIFREGQDLIATIRLLGALVETEATTDEAILIPPNLPANILFEISKIAWDRKIILLSTNLAHLENGVLMVFYPDENGLGQQLGKKLTHHDFSYENLKSAQAGLNLRVAQHLDVRIEPSILDHFTVKVR